MSWVRRFGHLAVDGRGHRVLIDEVDVGLTRSEFALIEALSSRPGVAMRNQEILEAIWGSTWQGDTTPLQVHVSRLRRKLGESGAAPRYIVTIQGFGYRFDPSPGGALLAHSGYRIVELHVDEQLVLRDIRPRVPLLGLQVEDIIGTVFSPTGLDRDTIAGILTAVLATGTRQLDGQINALSKDGSTHHIRARTSFLMDDHDKFMGILTHLYLPDD